MNTAHTDAAARSNATSGTTGQRHDFDAVVDRRTSNSMKWAGGAAMLTVEQQAADPLPMWVADTDFTAPKAVTDALHAAVDHGVFGYPVGPTPSYLEAVAGWQKRRFGWSIDTDWIKPAAGIITSLKTAVQAFSAPGDSILMQPPVYSHFHDDVRLNGRVPAFAPLRRTETGYVFDAEVFEAAITPDTKIFILSHPHNPTGNVWSEDELRTMGQICLRHNILVISDEIHEDLVMNPEKSHVPFASLSEEFAQNSITCTAPSKTFNLPGLQCANNIIPNAWLREEFARQYERNLFPLVNIMGMVACEAAYAHGDAWVDDLVAYVRGNHEHFAGEVNRRIPEITVQPADSLYLAWMDCRGLGMEAEDLHRFMLTQARIWFDQGQKFSLEGHGYMRANLGCPRSTVDEAIERLVAAVETWRSRGTDDA